MICDPSLLEIVRSHFSAICINMCHAIERTSYTTYVTESGDFTALLVSPDGRQFMYPRTAGVAGFLGLTLTAALDAVGGAEAMREGDIVISNDPYTTCGLSSHLPDISLFKPVFAEGRLVCFLWAFIHSSDVGGSVPTSLRPDATDIQMEGLRIPPVHLYREGELNGAVRSTILAASRQPQLLLGDINCMVSAMNVGEERMGDCIRKFGVDTVLDAQADLLEIAEQRARAVIASIPDGTHSFEDYLDDDYVSGVPLRIAVDLTVEGDGLVLDFSRSDPQTASAFNLVTGGSHHPYLYQGLINFIVTEDPFIPLNAGLTEPIRVIAPEGTAVNAQYPAACGLRHPLSMRLFSATLGALAQAIPERVAACGASQADIVSLSVPDESRGGVMSAMVVEPIGGGDGGRVDVDGIDGIDHSTGFLRNTPIETIESRTNVVVERYEFVADTAGAGRHRGGSALRLDFRPTVERALVGSRGKGHVKFEPYGLAGGKAGQLGRSVLNPGTEREAVIEKLAMEPITSADMISITTPSGGGWGDPRLRDPSAVLADVENGLLSIGKAATDYGVAVVAGTDGLAIDGAATERFRAAMAPSDDPIDIGDARRAYERIWTPAASDALAALSQTVPANRRPIRKQQVHDHFAGRIEPLAPADIEAAWDLFEPKANRTGDALPVPGEDIRGKIEAKVALDETVPREQFVSAVKSAIQARSTITYLIWKELEAELGAERATEVLGRAHRAFGQRAGAQWKGVADAQTALLAQCSAGGYAVFQQQLGEVGPHTACKVFGSCPHVEQFRALGATDEEIRILCQDVLSEGDYGNIDPHEGIALVFDEQIGAGDDRCVYRLTCDAH